MIRNRACVCILCAAAAALIAFLMFTPTPATAADPPVSFINDIAPILKENCLACHEPKKKSGKYDLSTYERVMIGGTNGEMVIPGKPDESELYTLMIATEGRRMPPENKGEPVSREKAALVRRWIAEGAKIDAGISPKADLVKELRLRWKPPVPPTVYKFPTVINALAFTPDGQQLVVGGQYELTIWSVADGKLRKRLRTRAERAYGLAFLPSGALAVAGGQPGQEGNVCIYDLAAKPMRVENGVAILDGVSDPKVLLAQLLDSNDSVLCLTLSPDGKKLAAGGCDRAVRVWDVSGGATHAKLEQTIENHADWVLGVRISPDGKYLLTAARDKTAKVWELTTKESLMTFPSHQNIVYDVAVSSDSKTGFSVGADKIIRSWAPGGNGAQIKTGGGHGDEVFKIALSHDGTTLATGSADKTVRLWDSGKLTATKTLTGLTDSVFALAFSPDGKRIAGGSYSGEVRIWNVADGKEQIAFNASPGFTAPASTTPNP
ncbi:MAG: hypothetical protein LC104_05665 [Bacteroidales bacterium]|nr:hypothetical protein [Bacteroidales bacterium]